MLVELSVVEQRYHAVMEVVCGGTLSREGRADRLVGAGYVDPLIRSFQAVSNPNSCSRSRFRSCRKARARVVPIPPGGIPVAWATSA
jgi:hypothetical protein